MEKNVGMWDRFIKGLFCILLFILGFYWISGLAKYISFFIALFFLTDCIFGFSIIYKFLNYSNYKKVYEELNKSKFVILGIILAVILIAGIFFSSYYTKKKFIEKIDSVEEYNNLLLENTINENRDNALNNYKILLEKFDDFYYSYEEYKPYAIRKDKDFDNDLKELKDSVYGLEDKIRYGNITAAYYSLERMLPIFNDIKFRNKVVDMKTQLGDFYNSLSLVIESGKQKDAEEIMQNYFIANEKLKVIEKKLNDTDIQLVRANLDAINELAKTDELEKMPSRAAELKSSFLRVYMGKR